MAVEERTPVSGGRTNTSMQHMDHCSTGAGCEVRRDLPHRGRSGAEADASRYVEDHR